MDTNLKSPLSPKIIEMTYIHDDNLPLLDQSPLKILKDFSKITKTSLLISFSFFSNLFLLIINLHFIGKFEDPILLGAIGL